MKSNLLYYVHFKADFSRPDNVMGPTGEELAEILFAGLTEEGIEVTKAQEFDVANYLECQLGSSEIELLVGADLEAKSNDQWYISSCQKRGNFRDKPIPEEVYRDFLIDVNNVIHNSPRISEIRWFPGYDTLDVLSLMPLSDSPVRSPGYDDEILPLIRTYWRMNWMLYHPIFLMVFFLFAGLLLSTVPVLWREFVATGLCLIWFGMFFVDMVVLPTLISWEAKRKRMGKGEPPAPRS